MPNPLGNLNPTALWNTCIPPEGNKAIPVLIPFTTTVNEYLLDLTQIEYEKKISFIQSMFVDNSANSAALYIYVPLSQQRVVVPPFYQGYFAFMTPNPVQVTFTSTVATDLNLIVHVMNFPVNTHFWSTDPTFSQGPIQVSDVVLDTLLAGGYLPVLPQSPNGSGVIVTQLQGTLSATGTKTATGSTTVFTPAAYYNLKHINIGLSGDASLAAPGQLTIQIRRGTTVIKTFAPYLPGAPPTPANIVDEVLMDSACNYWSTVSGETLNINFSAALASGSLWYNFDYALTTTPG